MPASGSHASERGERSGQLGEVHAVRDLDDLLGGVAEDAEEALRKALVARREVEGDDRRQGLLPLRVELRIDERLRESVVVKEEHPAGAEQRRDAEEEVDALAGAGGDRGSYDVRE